jgi:hypothetical protein
MQAFQIPRNKMKLCMEAKELAMTFTSETDNTKKAVRQFFELYGSHVPCGVHHLGGIFFSIADAKSKVNADVRTLTDATSSELDANMSVQFLGPSFKAQVSVKQHAYNKITQTEVHNQKKKEINYSYSLKSIGPPANNLPTFKKLLSASNSTWAILDRGDTNAYEPVWNLLLKQGEKFKEPAEVMRKIWEEDEKKMENERKPQDTIGRKDKVKDELNKKKEDECIQKV